MNRKEMGNQSDHSYTIIATWHIMHSKSSRTFSELLLALNRDDTLAETFLWSQIE